MKTIKLASGKEISVLETTYYASSFHTSPASVAEAEALIAELTDDELTHVELWAGAELQDEQYNQTIYQMNVELTKERCFATYMLGEKSNIPAEIMDKAMAYDILMGGETNG